MKKMLTGCLAALVLAGCKPAMTDQISPATQAATISLPSSQGFAETEASLKAAISARNLKMFTIIDHGTGAKSVGGDIGASKLFIFGNLNIGTPLMTAEPTMGLELPMKILVHGVDDTVSLHRTDITGTIRRYGVTDQDARLQKIDKTLTAIMTEAAGK